MIREYTPSQEQLLVYKAGTKKIESRQYIVVDEYNSHDFLLNNLLANYQNVGEKDSRWQVEPTAC